mmetsp:Transcript_29077/g.24447  ORF Transcript_29077/g.24447 Transcript_29077/m.24447 type:complete len:85 (+) Transcript_29077:1180-1434(+)
MTEAYVPVVGELPEWVPLWTTENNANLPSPLGWGDWRNEPRHDPPSHSANRALELGDQPPSGVEVLRNHPEAPKGTDGMRKLGH